MAVCYLGIGSNLGDRRRNIRRAVQKLRLLKDTRVIKVSRAIETKPVGGPAGQPKFLNSAVKIRTELGPVTLLRRLKKIETDLGRVTGVPCGPRVIDLDILLYGDRIINRPDLVVPHPRMFEREFVLKPLAEVI